MLAIALVDFDNIDPPKSGRSDADAEFALQATADALVAYLLSCGSTRNELHLRLYGGWLDEDGRFTPRAELLRRVLHSIRGLNRGVRVLPHLTLTLAAFPSGRLRGTLRRTGGRPGQKMVDTMIASDAIHLADDSDSLVLVVSDDDDLLPAAITASARRNSNGTVHLLRHRPPGRGMNDMTCTESGSVLSTHGIVRPT